MSDARDILFLDHVGVLGGAELSLCDIAEHFGQRGRVVLLADGPFRRRLEQRGVAVDVIAAPAGLSSARREDGAPAAMRAGAALVKLIARLYPTARRHRLLYANSQKAFVLAACLGIVTRRPVIWHLRDLLSEEHFSKLNRRVTTRLAKRCKARVIANSNATRDAFIEAGGQPERVVTIHNGIAADQIDAIDDHQRAAVRRELGIGQDAWLVGAFSRLATWKGQHVLIEAIARTPGVHALLVGEALFGEDAYRHRLIRQIDQLGLADRVHMLGFRDDVPGLMKACDVIAHTSIAAEPFGRVIVEGMLARRPVIATDAGGAREIIRDAGQGLRVPPRDVAALAEAIVRLQNEPGLLEALAQGGRRRAEAAFSVQAMLRKIDQQIDAILDGAKPPADRDLPPTLSSDKAGHAVSAPAPPAS